MRSWFIKRRLEQALKLSGSTDFASITDRLNKRRKTRFKEEQSALQALSAELFVDYSERSSAL